MINVETKSSGHFKIEVKKAGRGNYKFKTVAEFENLITDYGLNSQGTTRGLMGFCYVGSGTTPPKFSDTVMESLIGAVNSGSPTGGDIVNKATEDYVSVISTFVSGVGTVAGNISEIGVGTRILDDRPYLFSRSLVKDGLGHPNTITVLPDEILKVTYEHRYYYDKTETTGTFTLSGNIGGTFNYTKRPAMVGTRDWSAEADQMRTSPISAMSTLSQFGFGVIGDMTGKPTFEEMVESTFVNLVADGASLSSDRTLGINVGNFEKGINCLYLCQGCSMYQYQIDPPIMKTEEDILTLRVKHSWGRR